MPKASMEIEFAELPGISENILIGYPTLKKWGMTLGDDKVEFSKLGLTVPTVTVDSVRRVIASRAVCRGYQYVEGPKYHSIPCYLVHKEGDGDRDLWVRDAGLQKGCHWNRRGMQRRPLVAKMLSLGLPRAANERLMASGGLHH